MKTGRAAGILVGVLILGLAATAAVLPWRYLSAYGARARLLAVLILACGAGVAAAAGLLVARWCRSRWRAIAAVALVIALLLAPPAAMAYPGRINYARFGLTVYGILPVPFLDVTIGPHGLLWFRDKTHSISIDEVRPLLAPGVAVLVVGTGWYGAAAVDPAIAGLEGVEVHVLPTPAAFRLFNELRSLGRRVVLIAHSTC